MDEQKPFASTQEHVFTTDAKRWRNLKGPARQNRHVPTKAEERLWQALRGGSLGVRFRRQHVIEQFIVDFVCLSAWLVVEVDGEVHHEANQATYDEGRTFELSKRGFRVVRFSNAEVLHRIENVIERIRAELRGGGPHPLAPSP